MESFNSNMTIEQHQIVLYSKIKICYDLLISNPDCVAINIENLLKKGLNKIKDFLIYDVKIESYKMLIINYLIALLGWKKNDKISLQKHPIKGREKEIKIFIESKSDLINKLYKARDSVYSHFDLNFYEKVEKIDFAEIKAMIDFIKFVLPKESELRKI